MNAVCPADNLLRAQFHITGLSCASCVNKVERHLKKKAGGCVYWAGSHIIGVYLTRSRIVTMCRLAVVHSILSQILPDFKM